jgi:outer membrane biosynthesis protein TonB
MRSGLAISVIGHVTILTLGLLFAGANPFDSVPAEAITVDIVSPNEVDTGPAEPGAPAPAPQAAPAFEAVPAPQAPPPAPRPQPAPQATPQPPPRANTRNTRQAAAPPQAVPTPPPFMPQMQPAPPPQPAPQPLEPSAGDMFGMPLTMPDGKLGGGFGDSAMAVAKISADDTAAFRNRLKACATLPASVSPNDQIKIVMRVRFKRDGTLAGEPKLQEGPGVSGIAKGVAMRDSAVAALHACQPFTMLPADKYNEWKELDLSFTPQDFSRG